MKKRKVRSGTMAEGEIDLTPLIDCIFLLLIFFMVTTVFVQVKGLVVDLPGEADQEEEQQQKKDVNISVSAAGEYAVGGVKVVSSALAGAIKGAMDENNNRNIIIQGDAEAHHENIVFVMDMANSVGAEGMAFAIEEDAEEVE